MRGAGPLAGLVALGVLVWMVPLQLGWYQDGAITDIPVYREAAERMVGGAIPYRDFAFEYPPGAAGIFVLAWPGPFSYGTAFSALMLICLAGTALLAVATARALDLSQARVIVAGVGIVVAPLLVGSLVETRFDLALSVALAGILYGAATRRFAIAWGALAIGALIKLVPLVLIPALFIYHWHTEGPRRAATGAAGAVAAFLVVWAPFIALSPSGTLDFARYHLDRPLQIESTGAAYMLGLHALADIGLSVETSFGSQNLVGAGPDAISAISTAVLIVLVVAIAVALALALRATRPPGDARLFVAAVAATLVAMLVAGKVLSPQFMLWLLPAALLIAGPTGWGAIGATAAALILTQAYFPGMYWDLVALDTIPISLLVLRDLALIAVLVMSWPRPRIARSPAMSDAARASPSPLPARYILD